MDHHRRDEAAAVRQRRRASGNNTRQFGSQNRGIEWKEELVAQRKVQQLRAGGYPNRYVGQVGHILPLLAHDFPDHEGITVLRDEYVWTADRKRNITLHADKIAACHAL